MLKQVVFVAATIPTAYAAMDCATLGGSRSLASAAGASPAGPLTYLQRQLITDRMLYRRERRQLWFWESDSSSSSDDDREDHKRGHSDTDSSDDEHEQRRNDHHEQEKKMCGWRKWMFSRWDMLRHYTR